MRILLYFFLLLSNHFCNLVFENKMNKKKKTKLMSNSNQTSDTKLINQLQTENEELKSELKLFQTKLDRSEKAYDLLLHNLKQLQRNQFGKKSERFIDPNNPQADLFADVELPEGKSDSDSDMDNEESNIIHIPAHQRKKRKNKGFPPNLPRREIIIAAIDRICSCGKEKKLVRYEITELLHFIPAIFEVLVQKREILACSCGCSGSITIAPNPARILPKTSVTDSVLVHTIVSKLYDRQPLYHLEKVFRERFDIDLSRNNLARWFIDSSKALQPLINIMKDEIIDYDIASSDATEIQVLNEPNRTATQKSYWFCMRGGPPDKKIVLYDYNPTQHKQFLVNWFDGFKGIIHVDAQNIFDALEYNGAKLSYCNAHARRKFEPIAKGAKADGLAKHTMRIFRKLYKIERDAKNQKKQEKLTESKFYQLRYKLRQEQSKPIVDKFKIWLDENYKTVLPQSPLGKAFAYSIKHWGGLIRFLDDGRVEFDNNLTEQQIKPAVMARKNFLFASSVDGAKALCVHLSLIQTSLAHNFDPYAYYMEIFKKIPHCKTLEDYEKLLPWNIELNKVRVTKAA